MNSFVGKQLLIHKYQHSLPPPVPIPVEERSELATEAAATHAIYQDGCFYTRGLKRQLYSITPSKFMVMHF